MQLKLSFLTLRVVMLTGLLSISVAARAVPFTEDFESLSGDEFPAQFSYGQAIGFDDFLLETTAGLGGFSSWKPGANYTGTIAIFANQTEADNSLKRNGNAPFSIFTIDIALSDLNQPTQGQLEFTATKANNTTVSESFMIDATLTTFTFSSQFENIVSLDWSQAQADDNNHQFDNLRLDITPVPAPPALALFAFGLAGIWFSKRKMDQA